MRILRDYAELSSQENSLVVFSAAWFGFAPTRAAWFVNARSIYYEQGLLAAYHEDPGSVPPVGWWTGWLTIGYVTPDEALGMAGALDRSGAGYREHPGEVPAWLAPFPAWDEQGAAKLVQSPDRLDAVEATAAFLRGGGFESETRKRPWAHVLWR